jgi:hypothetical protein
MLRENCLLPRVAILTSWRRLDSIFFGLPINFIQTVRTLTGSQRWGKASEKSYFGAAREGSERAE